MRAMGSEAGPARRGRWIPWIFVAGFALVILVNGVMIYIALASFTGLQTEEHYQRGLEYNQVLEAERTQEALGWTVDVNAEDTGDRRILLSIRAADATGSPLNGADVKARLVRPVQSGHDMDVILSARGHGRYAADVELPLRGQWDILAQITHPSGSYTKATRIVTR